MPLTEEDGRSKHGEATKQSNSSIRKEKKRKLEEEDITWRSNWVFQTHFLNAPSLRTRMDLMGGNCNNLRIKGRLAEVK